MITNAIDCRQAADAAMSFTAYQSEAGTEWQAGCIINNGGAYFVPESGSNSDGVNGRAGDGDFLCRSLHPTNAPTSSPTKAPTNAAVQLNVARGSKAGYVNDWDGTHSSNCDGTTALTGLYSKHNNHYEDRKMKFKCGAIASGITTGSVVGAGSQTNWDGSWERTCPTNSYMIGFHSKHSNGKEDRKFTFRCREITNAELSRTQSGWTSWKNGWDKVLDYTSPANTFITGVKSEHHNGKEDRRFKFKYSTFTGQLA
jgi:hypothetical protein